MNMQVEKTHDLSSRSVGFIGLGAMGWPMAANLAKAGVNVIVYDVDSEKAEKFSLGYGVKAAATALQLAPCTTIITMLPTGKIVRDALTQGGSDSLINALPTNAVVVDMSSSEPNGTIGLGEIIHKRAIHLIDAPVSGGVARAQTGELTIMIGADSEEAFVAVEPILMVLGSRLFRTGKLGSGHAMKAINNFVASATFAATSEGLRLAEGFGLDMGSVVDILNTSTGQNFHTLHVVKEQILGEKYNLGFAVGLLAKDVLIATELGEQLHLDTPVLKLMCKRWAEARDVEGFSADYTSAHKAWAN